MQRPNKFLGLALTLAITAQFALPSWGKPQATDFTVRIENISDPAGQTATEGTRWPFALSPGTWLLTKKDSPLFRIDKPAGDLGLENQAEDGNPAVLKESLGTSVAHGVFNTPVGSDKKDAIGPGGVYQFKIRATPGQKLTLAMMFGQSNDLFYAPNPSGIPLFDKDGHPKSGDVTGQLILWDAGTEVNQEPGIGSDQAPRQKDANTGAAEGGVVHPVKDQFTYPPIRSVMKVTITPQ
jgi:hypothetical protein